MGTDSRVVVPLSLSDLENSWAEIEAVIDETAEIDRWCSGPDWVLPVHAGFGQDTEPLLFKIDTDIGPGYTLLARYHPISGDPMLAGLEPLWGFASPVLGADVAGVTAQLAHHLASDPNWISLALPGMPMPTGPNSFAAKVAGGLASLGPIRAHEGIVRQVANIGDGYEPWFGRRSSRFRQRLRQNQRRADQAGVHIVEVSSDPGLFDRLLAIETSSWKGLDESGITSPEMSTTYRAMLDRLQARLRLRAYVARLDGDDIGYILGGVRNRCYRGLQLSYRDDASELSVGHLLQWHQIRELCRAGEADRYDLGMDLDYKRRWADQAEPSLTLIVERG
ncbi:MAG: GNAT family N-acetyltransferase [Actinomycetia bacterium]|nr:GNAT family N-acetyltransferase [Actinomycetes bacterium]